MGVMYCHRNGCNNIMCHTYISDIGYICYNCQQEFLNTKGCKFESRPQFIKKLKKFMNKEKEFKQDEDLMFDAEEYFRKLTV